MKQMPLQQRHMFILQSQPETIPHTPAVISLTLRQARPLGREQEDHIQLRTGRPYPTLHYHHHNKSAFRHALRERERERGVAYLRQIILSQLYLEARMRRLGSIMPPRRRSTRCRVDSATHSHIYCRVQTGAQTGVQTGAHTHTVHNNQRQRSGGRE